MSGSHAKLSGSNADLTVCMTLHLLTKAAWESTADGCLEQSQGFAGCQALVGS